MQHCNASQLAAWQKDFQILKLVIFNNSKKWRKTKTEKKGLKCLVRSEVIKFLLDTCTKK